MDSGLPCSQRCRHGSIEISERTIERTLDADMRSLLPVGAKPGAKLGWTQVHNTLLGRLVSSSDGGLQAGAMTQQLVIKAREVEGFSHAKDDVKGKQIHVRAAELLLLLLLCRRLHN
jgi:hypothetical protein